MEKLERSYEQLEAELAQARQQIEAATKERDYFKAQKENQKLRAESAEQQLAAAQAALLQILKLDAADTAEGFNEWGEAQSFRDAQQIAKDVLAEQPTDALRAFVLGLLPNESKLNHSEFPVAQGHDNCLAEIRANLDAALGGKPQTPPASQDGVARPKVVCLCGSTRFYPHFQEANYRETMAGRVVLSVGFYPHAAKEVNHSEDVGCTPEQKVALDELHKRKIDLTDEVYVLNVGGYIGSSTRSEIDYAIAHNKPVRYLEPRAGRDLEGAK